MGARDQRSAVDPYDDRARPPPLGHVDVGLKRAGARGIRWQGARLITRFEHTDWRWLECETQYLTTAGSNLVAVTVSLRNRTTAVLGANAGVNIWPSAGSAVAHVDRDRKVRTFRPDTTGYGVHAGKWLAFGGDGAVMACAAPGPDPGWGLDLSAITDGSFTAHIGRWLYMHPDAGRMTGMLWLAACRTVDETYAYRSLAELDELP